MKRTVTFIRGRLKGITFDIPEEYNSDDKMNSLLNAYKDMPSPKLATYIGEDPEKYYNDAIDKATEAIISEIEKEYFKD